MRSKFFRVRTINFHVPTVQDSSNISDLKIATLNCIQEIKSTNVYSANRLLLEAITSKSIWKLTMWKNNTNATGATKGTTQSVLLVFMRKAIKMMFQRALVRKTILKSCLVRMIVNIRNFHRYNFYSLLTLFQYT